MEQTGKWVMVLMLLVGSLATAAEWTCGDEDWIGSPGMKDGVFQATVASTCTLSGISRPDFKALREAILATIRAESVVHGNPVNIRVDGMAGISLDVTNTIEESGSPVKVREEAQIFTDEKSKFTYRTQSKQVEARGIASYLRKVTFQTEIVVPEGATQFEIRMRNTVHVERPWFALAPLFVVIAKGVSKSKFKKARAQLMTYISANL